MITNINLVVVVIVLLWMLLIIAPAHMGEVNKKSIQQDKKTVVISCIESEVKNDKR